MGPEVALVLILSRSSTADFAARKNQRETRLLDASTCAIANDRWYTETMLPRRAGGCEWTVVEARVPSFTGAEAGVAQSDITVMHAGYENGETSVGDGDIFQVIVAVIIMLLSLWTLMIIPEIDRYIGLEKRAEKIACAERSFNTDSEWILKRQSTAYRSNLNVAGTAFLWPKFSCTVYRILIYVYDRNSQLWKK